MRDLGAAIAHCRWLLDLDADPEAIDHQLAEDRNLRSLIAGAPGRRIPRTVDGGLTRLFSATDLGVRRGALSLGLPASPSALTAYADQWRPWRAYAVQHLWATNQHPINPWPPLPAAQSDDEKPNSLHHRRARAKGRLGPVHS